MKLTNFYRLSKLLLVIAKTAQFVKNEVDRFLLAERATKLIPLNGT